MAANPEAGRFIVIAARTRKCPVNEETIRIALAAGAYGSALFLFAYGAYVLIKAKSPTQSQNARWFLCVGAVVVIALIGLDYAKFTHAPAVAKHRLYLSFAPTFTDMQLPNPRIKYLGKQQSIDAPILIENDNSSVEISMQATIEALQQLRKAFGNAALSNQPQALIDEVSTSISDPGACDAAKATCGWAKLATGDLGSAESVFKEALSGTPAADAETRATVLLGLGETYVGQGRIEDAEKVFLRASRLGNTGAQERLEMITKSRE